MKYLEDTKGVALIIEILLVAAVLIMVGLSAYGSYHKKKSVATVQTLTPQATPQTSPSPSRQPTPSPPLTTITPKGGSPLQIVLPPGWASLATSQLTATIDSVPFVITFQVSATDALRTAPYGGDDALVKLVTTDTGKSLYILKSPEHSEAYISSCAPQNGYACALSQNATFVLVNLEQYQPSTQSPLPLNFASPSTTAAITSFETVAAGLQL
jgi:hypothetical protein